MTEIKQISENKEAYMQLLLLADEQESMVRRYLDRGEMFTLTVDGETAAVCIVTDEGNSTAEIKNIAVKPEFQRRGYGRRLIEFVEERCSGIFSVLLVGTGDSPLTVPFYESCGFARSHKIENFFTENYDHPLFEAGVQLVDMIYLVKKLG